MLWYKSWLDTRWRFLIGLAVSLVSACSILFTYVQLQPLLPALGAASIDAGGSVVAAAIAESIELQKTFRGFVWSQWFDQNASTLMVLLAALLGSGSPFAQSGRGALFTLALPAPRSHWLGARMALGVAQLFVLGVVPALLIGILAPSIGEQYGLGEALVHGLCVFVVAVTFFTLALLLSTLFADLWRPLLLTVLAALALGLGEAALRTDYGLFGAMSAAAYFRGESLPWAGLTVSVALSAVLGYAAVARVARRDF